MNKAVAARTVLGLRTIVFDTGTGDYRYRFNEFSRHLRDDSIVSERFVSDLPGMDATVVEYKSGKVFVTTETRGEVGGISMMVKER